jgi:hypothetical protein
MVEHARREGFIYDEHRALFACVSVPGALLDALESFTRPGGLDRWLNRED